MCNVFELQHTKNITKAYHFVGIFVGIFLIYLLKQGGVEPSGPTKSSYPACNGTPARAPVV